MKPAKVIDSSTAKNQFGKIADMAKAAPVEVLRHGQLDFVAISPEDYEQFKTAVASSTELQRMQREFDKLCEAMQDERSVQAYDALLALPADKLTATVKNAFRKARAPARRGAAKSVPRKKPQLRAAG